MYVGIDLAILLEKKNPLENLYFITAITWAKISNMSYCKKLN